MAAFSQWILPSFVALSVTLALTRRLDIFQLFIEGAEQGLRLVVQIFPYILGMYVAIGIFQAGGALSLLTQVLSPLLAPLHFPPELLPLAIIRPLSGAAALGYLVQVLERFGPDSFTGRLASVMQGSSETTFYV
ncbi:MAG: nucleoside recognition domain-containing protein, partial [Bacillota bacterium]|nr:nucleoside recognition domain-containing protein [Bacillota bacterium]